MDGDRDNLPAWLETKQQKSQSLLTHEPCLQYKLQGNFHKFKSTLLTPHTTSLMATRFFIFPLINYHNIKPNAKILIFKIGGGGKNTT